MSEINCNGKILDLTSPKTMGILNITPDSFYDGGAYSSNQEILDRIHLLLEEGADIIDVGGMSSRPGAELVSSNQEWDRVAPVLEIIKTIECSSILSIDTIHATVAKAAVENGVGIVNDISAGSIDDNMMETVAKLNVPYIIMHMKGQPKDMQLQTSSQSNTLNVLKYLIEKERLCHKYGIKDVIVDPGFGFGKSISQNYQLLKKLDVFKIMERPILVGLSRKSMIYKPLKIEAQSALNGTTALHMIALQNGANILRTHDVKAAKEAIKLNELLLACDEG
jgi:dihydropteroate synthase